MNELPKCFKAYDVRGTVDEELTPQFCAALGKALAGVYRPASVILGHDARLSSPGLEDALAASLGAQGASAYSLGLCGTEELYYAASRGDHDLGIMVTGSHNPVNENGFKFVGRGATPISDDSGLLEVAQKTADFMAESKEAPAVCGKSEPASYRESYLDWLLSYSGLDQDHVLADATRLRVVVDAGNGCAGPVVSALAPRLPIELHLLGGNPDGTFPGGVPNPLLPGKRKACSAAVQEKKANLGVAFDGDFDRCFFFDHNGRFVESCYVVGLLAAELLTRYPDEKIIHDSRVYWNTCDLVYALGGQPVVARGGHSYMKEAMRKENAIYGGEMSGHYFYRDFAFCDSGMLTFLLMLSLLARSGHTLAELVEAGMAAYPCSGEVNFRVADAKGLQEEIWKKYERDAVASDRLDGISMEFPEWRFNLRSSNTEPLLRLNIESRGDPALVRKKLAELSRFIKA